MREETAEEGEEAGGSLVSPSSARTSEQEPMHACPMALPPCAACLCAPGTMAVEFVLKDLHKLRALAVAACSTKLPAEGVS
jgi:hypothetical protein